MTNEYTVDFTIESRESGHEYQSSATIVADNDAMANVIFYDALDQMWPEDQFKLVEVGSYEYNQEAE